MQKQKVFICHKWPELTIAIKGSHVQFDRHGDAHQIPGKYAVFSGGVCRVTDPVIIEGLREMMENHVGYKDHIKELADESELPKSKGPVVKVGVIGSGPRAKLPEPPKVHDLPAVSAVITPKRRGRPPNKHGEGD